MDLKGKKRQPLVTVILFCLFIFGFAAATTLKSDTEFSETENRVLAQMPERKAEAVLNGDFEADYEEYLTDQFIWRDRWIGIKTLAERMLLKRESKDIYFAEDGYLIEKHSGTFKTQTARRNITALADFVQKYEERLGTSHISVLLVPNAADILLDKLPPFADSGEGGSYLEEITGTLPEGVLLDAESVLQAHADEELYYRTDHHWKTRAAFYVYQAWAEKQRFLAPELTDYNIAAVTDTFEGTIQSKLGIQTSGDTIELFLPIKEPAYTVYEEGTGEIKNTLYDYAALDTKDKYAVYFGGNKPFLKINTEADNGRKILVVKDSYANCFIPFMLGEFQEIDVLDLRYTNQKLSEIIDTGKYTDLLVLYNAAGFAEDMSITKLKN